MRSPAPQGLASRSQGHVLKELITFGDSRKGNEEWVAFVAREILWVGGE